LLTFFKLREARYVICIGVMVLYVIAVNATMTNDHYASLNSKSSSILIRKVFSHRSAL